MSGQSGIPSAWVHPVGSGLATQITDGSPVSSVSWLPNGQELLVVRGPHWCLSGDCLSIERHSRDGGPSSTIAKGWSPDVSADGKLMVFSIRKNAEWDLAVKTMEGAEGAYWPRWSHDGRRLYYATSTGVMAVEGSTKGSLAVGTHTQILPRELWRKSEPHAGRRRSIYPPTDGSFSFSAR